MRARLFALLLTAPLLTSTLTGCDLAGELLVPGAIHQTGTGGVVGGGLAITRFDADPSKVLTSPGDTRRLSVEANRTGTSFSWSASGGTLSGTTGASNTWTAPDQPGTYRIDVTARNGSDEAKASFQFTVAPQ